MESEQKIPGKGSSADGGIHAATQPLVPSLSEAKPDETTEKAPEKTPEVPKLITALLTSNREAIKALLVDGSVDPNATYNDETPFLYAIATRDPLIVQMFLDSPRVDHNALTEFGHVPLDIAVDRGSQEIVQQLLASPKIDPNLNGLRYGNPYDLALESASPEIFQMFLKCDRVVHRVDKGSSPLEHIMVLDDVEKFKTLINKYKIGPKTIGNNNATNALLRSVLYNYDHYNGKDPKWAKMVFEENLIDDPLVMAVQKNDLDAIKDLLTTSIQAEPQNCESSIYTALMLALHQHKPNIVKELIKDKRINVNDHNHFIIKYAIDKGDSESIVELLKNIDFHGPLTTAVNNNKLDTVKDLLTGGLELFDFKLALMQAVIDKKLNMVEELLKYKDWLSSRDIYLDAARIRGHDDVFNALADSTNKDQGVLESKIVAYLRSQNRADSFIDAFAKQKGFCWAISNLWLYGKWLQTEPKRPLLAGEKEKPRDDNDRFERTVRMIVNWDEKRELSAEEKYEFEQIIAKLVFLQSMSYRSSDAWAGLTKHFPELDIEDTVMAQKGDPKRTLKKEFSFGSIFTLDSLELFLSTKGVIQDRRLIFVNSPEHATGLFKKDNDYYYFDPNSRVGAIKCKTVRQISELIFKEASISHTPPREYHDGINVGVGFMMFSFDKTPVEKYPAAAEVLDRMHPPLYIKSSPPYWGLEMAVRVNSPKTTAYFINKILIEEASPPLPEPLTKEKLKSLRISLVTATGWNNLPIIAAQLALWDKIEECPDNEVKKFYQTLFNNSPESAKAFLDNPEISAEVKLDVFEEAVKIQNSEIVKTFLESDEISISHELKIKMADSPAIDNNSEIVKTFLESDKISHELKMKGFRAATRNKNLEIVKMFLDWDKLDTKAIEFECRIAAAVANYLPIELFLKSNKIDPNRDFSGRTLLTVAIDNGHFSSVNALLDDPRVNPTLRDHRGRTPLEIAKEKGYKEIIDRLSAAITAWEVKSQARPEKEKPQTSGGVIPSRVEKSAAGSNDTLSPAPTSRKTTPEGTEETIAAHPGR
jgi:ankyrin repeat protein